MDVSGKVSGDQKKEEPDITIMGLSSARSADYLAFFDRDAFADNPRWASCYCFFNVRKSLRR